MVGDASGDQDPAQGPHQVAAPPSSSPTLKVNQNVAVLGVLYGNKCKEAFEQVSRSVQALHGARKALTAYLERSSSGAGEAWPAAKPLSCCRALVASRRYPTTVVLPLLFPWLCGVLANSPRLMVPLEVPFVCD